MRRRIASQPSRSRSARSAARTTGRLPADGLDHDQVVLRRGGREPLEVDPGRDDGVRAGEPRGRARRRRPRRSPRACRSARADGRAGSCGAGSRAAPGRRTWRRSSSGPRGGPRRRAPGTAGSNPWTTSKSPCRSAVATFARTPTGIPTAARGETGTARETATTPSSSPVWSARRPARRSAERDEGASTTTAWPRSRSASATPATCSFVSCGTDHA